MNKHIVEDELGYYYIDETYDLVGPFDTWNKAETAYNAFLKWETRSSKYNSLRKMKESYD